MVKYPDGRKFRGRFLKFRTWAIVCLPAIMIIAGDAFGQQIRVSVNGEVAQPGDYAVRKGDRLSSLLERAGGFTDNAWMDGAAISRHSARAHGEARLRELVSGIERKVFAVPGEEARKREFLLKLSELEPKGLIPVRLAHPRLLKGSDGDLPLEDGDSLLVRSKKDLVAVIGAVKTPRTLPPSSSKTEHGDYIREAGGYAEDADRKHAYLVKADGTATPLFREWIRWNAGKSRWEIPAFSEPSPRVESGDTIVVPRKPAPSSWARDIDGLPRILMEIHVLTGVRIDPP
jgi:protein involved in polysaccharide export with SLBB domain